MKGKNTMLYDSSNIFARILREEITCDKVFENDHVLAFNDINPQAPQHILIIPKGDYCNFHDFHENAPTLLINEFYQAIRYVIQQCHLTKDGYRLITNCGADGGQIVDHYHVHLLGGKNLGSLITA